MSTASTQVLVVEDEPPIRKFVKTSLEGQDYLVDEADTLRRALGNARTRIPDVIVLDLGLPDGNGIDFILELRVWSDVPIIVLSAQTDEQEKVKALDAGADDYLTKPFGAAELLARVRAQLRRKARAANRGQTIEFGQMRLDLERRLVSKAGQPIHLTPIEYRLLTCLATNPDRVITSRQLLREVWGPAHAENLHYVRTYMAFLRKKVECNPASPQHILTEAGVGYRFVI